MKEIDPFDPFTEPLTDKERIELLENQINDLKNRIVKIVTIDGTQETPYTAREIVQTLFDWANGDD